MSFCSGCGTKLDENARYCPTCGQPAGAPGDPAGAQATAEEADIRDNKALAILAYILFLIPLLAAPKDSKFARYHTNQGLVLFLGALALGVAEGILDVVLGAMTLWSAPFFGIILALTKVLWLAPLALAIIGIINAANGAMKPLPVIGTIQLLH